MRTRLEAVMAATCLALAPLSPSVAQSYPARPVHIIVAFAPGGPVDVVARLAAEKLPEILGQPVVVENRPSSTGNLGTQVVAKAPPDGYTILATSSAFAVNVSLSPNAGYDPDRDFAPIIQAATQPNVIVVNSEFPAKTLAELLEMAKTAKLAYASPGTGTTPHLTGEHIFKAIAKLDVVHIPYKGAGPAAVAVVAGEPPIGSLAVTAPCLLRSGRLRALAISSATRHPLLPEVPTFTELGYPEIEEYTWVGFFAPAGTPPEVVQKLNEAINRVLQMPIRERLESLTWSRSAAHRSSSPTTCAPRS